jgi:dTDP-4-amino-4,6-dideoxygalactose transaminase
MRIGRTLPPAAAPIYPRDILSGIRRLVNGHRELIRFETELKHYFEVKYCFLVSSGKAALSFILQTLRDIEPERDEVLIPAFTCYSVPSAIVRAGLKVKLCDTNPNTLDFDYDQLSSLLSQASPAKSSLEPNKPNQLKERNKLNKPKQPNKPASRLLGIIPTHLFGIPSDIVKIRKLILDPKVTVVEDAAQTMGIEWEGKKLGTFGDIGFFSLGRGKAFSAVEGGVILTNRYDIAAKLAARIESAPRYNTLEMLALFFKAISLCLFVHPSLYWLPRAIPFLKLGQTMYDPHFRMQRMTAFQAGLAKTWQRKLKEFRQIRAENSRQWSIITQSAQLRNYCSGSLSSNPINMSNTTNSTNSNFIRFPVKVDDRGLRERILRISDQMGLGVMPTYPNSIDRIPEMRNYIRGQRFPKAKQLADNLITLPTHSFVTQKDKRQIAALISRITHNEP